MRCAGSNHGSGISLLSRTTRSISPTEAGERLLSSIAPRLEQMEGEIAPLKALRDKSSGTIRITTSDHPARAILLSVVEKLLPPYPDIKVEIVIDHGLTNIVAERYDAGIRPGEQVEKDMIAVQIGPDIRFRRGTYGQPVPREVFTHVPGTECYLYLRARQWRNGTVGGNRTYDLRCHKPAL